MRLKFSHPQSENKLLLYGSVMEMASGKSADQFFQNIAQQKAILIFSAILTKRDNLNLDLNLDLHGSKILAVLILARLLFVLMLYTRT